MNKSQDKIKKLTEENKWLRESIEKTIEYFQYEAQFQGMGKRRGKMVEILKEAIKEKDKKIK